LRKVNGKVKKIKYPPSSSIGHRGISMVGGIIK